jgi:rhamnogalacturonyl hydrolase YesR
MKNYLIIFISAILFFSCQQRNIVNENFRFAQKQITYALQEINLAKRKTEVSSELISPRSLSGDGKLNLVSSKDWCSGFFPGELWYLYEFTKNKKWLNQARIHTEILENEKWNGKTHDMGFKMYCSYGNAYRLTKDTTYQNVLLQSAKTLIKRYNATVGCIRSWDFGKEKWDFPVIIDNMMNLELLFWATKETGDSTYRNIAINHAQTTLKNHFRTDNSCYHVVDYNPNSGEVRKRVTHQGYSDESAWARGQAWAIYGFTMCYRETGEKEFLAQAEKTVQYFFTHPNLPEDLIPYWDFNAPAIPNEPRDVSAATVAASSLYELSGYVPEKSTFYKSLADKIIENITKNYRSKKFTSKGFLLLHSTGSKPHNSEIDVPLVYADYYFLEALLRKETVEKK